MLKLPSKGILTMGAAALMVFIAVAVATLEPLATLIRRTASFPPETATIIRIPETEAAAPTVATTLEVLRNFGATQLGEAEAMRIGEMLLPALNGPKTLIISRESNAVLPVTLTLRVKSADHETALSSLRRVLAYALPTEEKVTLPDETTSTEIIADPTRVVLSYMKEGTDERWSADGLPIPVRVRNFDGVVSLSTGRSPWNSAGKLLLPVSCRQKPDGERIVSFMEGETTLIPSFLASLKAYFRDFTCFQTFSTSSWL